MGPNLDECVAWMIPGAALTPSPSPDARERGAARYSPGRPDQYPALILDVNTPRRS